MMKTKKKVDWRVLCTGLICITGIELFALSKGINGVLLTTIVGVIALVIGIKIPTPKVLDTK